jgi:putative endonuclease
VNKEAYVYFMTNKNNKVLYIGITSNLMRRVAEHKAKTNIGFTEKYNCNKLVYYEISNSIVVAIEREKRLKNWKRCWKNELVNSFNPKWLDLGGSIGVTDKVVKGIVEQSYKKD